MSELRKVWQKPLFRQLFVVTGVSLNMANIGAATGFTAILLPQLRAPDSIIPVDKHSSSWIASILGISLFVGNVVVPSLMGKFGRKKASLISCTILTASWIWITLATSVTSLLMARFLQGLAVGITLSLCPIMIGELTSPTYRGIFSAINTSSSTIETLMVHILGSYASWQTTALVCTCCCGLSFVILFLSPESPSWLTDQRRYEDSAKAYRWLRGDAEENELEKMLEARKHREVIMNSVEYKEKKSVIEFAIRTFKKREFYMPVFIMVHLYALLIWTGMVFLVVFIVDTLKAVVGLTSDSDIALHVTILDLQRLVSTVLAIFLITKFKRRTVLFSMLGINIASLLVLAGYTFAKAKYILLFDHPAIGATLMHIHMFAITIGAVPLPVIISGELFPLEFRSLAGGISGLAFSLNFFVTCKTMIILTDAIGLHGTYAVYAAVTIYCTVIVWIFLPETKDRTLQDIEEEFKGTVRSRTVDELTASTPLKIEKDIDGEV